MTSVDRKQQYGLKPNVKKTKNMELGLQTDSLVNVDDPLQELTSFRYLGSSIMSEGGA